MQERKLSFWSGLVSRFFQGTILNSSPSTDLCDAVLNNNVVKVQALISSQEIDINSTGYENKTPLIIACEKGFSSIVFALLADERIDVDKRDKWRRTALFYACCHKDSLIGKGLLIKIVKVHELDMGNYTPLIAASTYGNTDMVEELLKRKDVQVNAIGEDDTTALDRAIQHHHSEIQNILRKHGAKTRKDLFFNRNTVAISEPTCRSVAVQTDISRIN